MKQPQAPPVDRRSTADISAEVQCLLVRYMTAAAGAGIGTGWQGVEQVDVADALGRVLYDDVVTGAAGHQQIVARGGALVDGVIERSLAEVAGTVSVVKLSSPPDPGQALVGIFAHLAGIIIERLNRTPDKALLAFLDLIGVRQLPPQPALVPLTFVLTAGANVDPPVPAGTRVAAAPAESEADPPVFETTGGLFLTGAQLVAAYVRDPARDAWADLSGRVGAGVAAGQVPGLAIFSGDRPIERRLWLAQAMLAGQAPRDVTVAIAAGPAGIAFPDLEWGRWDGSAWQPLPAPKRQAQDGNVTLIFAAVPPVPIADAVPANGGAASAIAGAWIGARLARQADQPIVLPATSITAINISTSVAADNLLPDAVLGGAAALDTTTDFLPFGDRPKLGDVLLLSCEQAFAPAGPLGSHAITLTVTASNLPDGRLPPPDPTAPPEPPAVTLAWEYWNGSRWRAIGQSSESAVFVAGSADYDSGLADNTRALMHMVAAGAAAITFRRPPDWAVSTIGGRAAHWLRVRIAGGGYGHDARYRLRTTKPEDGYVLDPATWRPPSLRMVTCAYSYASPAVKPDHVLVESDFALTDVTAGMERGHPGFALFPPLDEQTSALHLGFLRPGAPAAFANQPVTLYAGVDEISYDEIPNGLPAEPAHPPAVAWEYASPDGWRWLGAQDGTDGFTRSGLVTFIGPADLVPVQAFGRVAYWLRARWESGGYVLPPRLNRLMTNTVWASHATAITGEVIGSGTAEPGQTFNTSKAPVLAGQVVEVGETEVPSSADLAALIAEEGPDCVTVTDGGGRAPDIWVRWHETTDFYASAPGSRHYTVDRLNGVIAFGGGGRGRMPPRGSGNIRISYRSGGGAAGNRAAGTVTQLKTAVPYVDSVSNLVEAAGGADAEDMDSVRRRGPTTLRHRNRAVAIADFEDLALQASPAVARAKGLPPSGAASAGRVELVVVPRSSARRPVPSRELLQLVHDSVSALAPPTADLVVRGPDWVGVSVAVELTPVSFDRAMEVRNGVINRLDAFLHPLTGGFDGNGWAFGRSPHSSDLYALIEQIPGVDYIQTLATTMSPDLMTLGDHMLLYSADHQVTLLAPAREVG
jgi:hypothetical protein